MKTVLLGCRGQLGQDLARILPGEVIPLDRVDADLVRPETLSRALEQHRPDVVVNCAAYNFVDRAEEEPQQAFAVNALGVRALAALCGAMDRVLVHFSTDHTFGLDGDRRTPYDESGPPGPVNVYGGSKLAGEYFVRTLCPRHFVIRTCGLYGKHGQGGKGSNFVEAIIRLTAEGTALRVVDDQQCTPTATTDLAHAVAALLGTDAYGLYHLTNAGSCTWFEFAQAIAAPYVVAPIRSADYGAKARRPSYSVLDCAKFARLGLAPLRPWREALRAYLAGR